MVTCMFVKYFDTTSQGNLEKSNSFSNQPDKQLVACYLYAVKTRWSLAQLNVAYILVRFLALYFIIINVLTLFALFSLLNVLNCCCLMPNIITVLHLADFVRIKLFVHFLSLHSLTVCLFWGRGGCFRPWCNFWDPDMGSSC